MHNLKKKMCPECGQDKLIAYRMGEYNPNARSPISNRRICLDCYIDEMYKSRGVEA